jgi:diguanylate cyclase (GGDEF)-like protein/PAS domain S-box-containing protein
MAGLFNRIFARKPDGAGAPIDETFQLLAENSLDVILRVGPDLRTRYASPSALEMFGWTPQEMLEKGLTDTIPQQDLPEVAATLARLLSGSAETGKVTTRFRKKNGAVIWVEAKGRLIRNPRTGAAGDLVIVLRDVSDRKALESRVSELSVHDEVTGLLNRRAFDEMLDREWRRGLREGGEVSVLVIDVDHFAAFNDRYGAPAGDDCLRSITTVLRQALRRATDVAGRYTGGQLIAILPSTDADGAESVAEAVRAAVEALRLPHQGNAEGRFRVSVSIGAGTAFLRRNTTGVLARSLVFAAEEALAKAKQAGRNAVAAKSIIAPDAEATGTVAA